MSPDRVFSRINGPRGSALLCLGGLAAFHALLYSPFTQPPAVLPLGLAIMGEVIPIPAYGVLWGVTALLCWVAAFAPRRTRWRDYSDRASFGLIVFLLLVWAIAYFGGWSLYVADAHGWLDVPAAAMSQRSYFSAGFYATVAGAIAASTRMSNPTRGGTRAGVRRGGQRR